MKKIIALLLALSMLLGMTACGPVTMVTENLSVSIKGNGKKELTVTLTDKIDTVYRIEYEVDNGDAPVYEAAVAKEDANKHVYKVRALNPGSSTLGIKFLNGDKLITKVTMVVTANEAMHIFYSDLEIGSGDKLVSGEFVDGEGESAGEFTVTDDDSAVKTIQLANGGGWWEIGTYDAKLLAVSQKEPEDNEDVSVFYVEAKAEGTSDVILINPDTESQVALTFVAKIGDDELLHLKLASYVAGPLVRTTSSADLKKYTELEKEFGQTVIPDEAYISGIDYTPGPDGFGEVSFTYHHKDVNYYVHRGETADNLYSYVAEEYAIVTDKQITIGDMTVRYFFTDKGFGTAVWNQDDVAVRMTFMDMDDTDEEVQEYLQDVFEAGLNIGEKVEL